MLGSALKLGVTRMVPLHALTSYFLGAKSGSKMVPFIYLIGIFSGSFQFNRCTYFHYDDNFFAFIGIIVYL